MSIVTRSNDFPLPDVKTPSLVTFSKIGPSTLQGPHQLRSAQVRSTRVVSTLRDVLHVERRVLGVEVCYNDLVLGLKCFFESLMRATEATVVCS